MGINKPKIKHLHLLVYVENCSTRIKKFHSDRSMKTFITKFLNRTKSYRDDNWIDFTVISNNANTELIIYNQDIPLEE